MVELKTGITLKFPSNNLSNGSVLANFSSMKDNEANFCNGYNYANGRFCFNYRGAKSKITDYVFGDGLGTGGTVAKLSDLATKDDLLSIDVKKYTSGALSKGAQKEINLTFGPRTGYTRRYFVGELTGTGSNSIIVNVHGSTLSFFAFNTDANITATILCIYTKD